jgi:5-methylcytosine-specific restriction endonuclease McrA
MKVETRVRTHPKMIAAGPAASWLWFCGNCYAREHLTDGFIPAGMVVSLTGCGHREAKRHAATLVTVGLWHETKDGYQVHDFLDWNPSRADVDAGKEWDRRRKELYADKALVHSIRERDGDFCRYCDVEVRWSDRRGPLGGQFDHVIPRGPNTLENVVVSCRQCNMKKQNRTPEQAGMPLRTPSGMVKNQNGSSSGSGSGLDSLTHERAGASNSFSVSASAGVEDPENTGQKPNVSDLPPERPRSIVGRRDLSAFLQGPVFSIPQKWADKAIQGSNGNLTEKDLYAFGQALIDKVERERIDVTAQGNLLTWLDTQLKAWTASRSARSSGPSASRPASLRVIDEMEAKRNVS